MDLSADFLERFAASSPELQERFVQQVRDNEMARVRLAHLETEGREHAEQRWQRVPRWRRALILFLDYLQRQLTPEWL